MTRKFIGAMFAAFSLLATGCQSALVDETGPLSIRTVSVSTAPTVKSATDIGPSLQQASNSSLIRETPDGRPARVHIVIDNVTYKNAMMSLLVGSTNALNTTVSVTDESGKAISTFRHNEISDYAVNGIIGAAIAAGQDPAAVDAKLVDQYSRNIVTRIYGPPGHKPKKAATRPVQTTPAASPAPADGIESPPRSPVPQPRPAPPTS